MSVTGCEEGGGDGGDVGQKVESYSVAGWLNLKSINAHEYQS